MVIAVSTLTITLTGKWGTCDFNPNKQETEAQKDGHGMHCTRTQVFGLLDSLCSNSPVISNSFSHRTLISNDILSKIININNTSQQGLSTSYVSGLLYVGLAKPVSIVGHKKKRRKGEKT